MLFNLIANIVKAQKDSQGKVRFDTIKTSPYRYANRSVSRTRLLPKMF